MCEEQTTGAGLANTFFHRLPGGSTICRRPARRLAFPAPPRQQCGARHISQSDLERGDRHESALRRVSPRGEKNLAPAIMLWKAPTPTIVLFTMLAGALAAMAALKSESLLTPLPDGFRLGFHDANERETNVAHVPKDENVDDWSRMAACKYSMAQKASIATLSPGIWGNIGYRLAPAAARAKSRQTAGTAIPFRFGGMVARLIRSGKDPRRCG
jgi:hypothetical protein